MSQRVMSTYVIVDKTDRDTCIAILVQHMRYYQWQTQKQRIQLRQKQRNLPISKEPYHKAQSEKVKTQIETNQNIQTHITTYKLTPICELSSGLYNGAFKRNGYAHCASTLHQTPESVEIGKLVTTQWMSPMEHKSYVNLSY